MSAPMYAIATDIRQLFDTLDVSAELAEGEIPSSLESVLDGLTMAFESKAENICKFRVMLAGGAEVIKGEIDRLTKMKHTLDARAEWLKKYLLRCMLAAGVKKIDGPLFKLRVQAVKPTTTLAPGAEIPKEFEREKTEYSLDKDRCVQVWRLTNTVMGMKKEYLDPATAPERKEAIAVEAVAIMAEINALGGMLPDSVRVVEGVTLIIK